MRLLLPAWLLILISVQAGDLVVLMDETIVVEAGSWYEQPIQVRRQPGELNCSFETLDGKVIRAAVIRSDDIARFRHNPLGGLLAVTPAARESSFQLFLPPGTYVLAFDNRALEQGPVRAHVRVNVHFEEIQKTAAELPAARRYTVVAISLLLFFGLAWWSGGKVLTAVARRRKNGQFPPNS